jgi:hypothetical protein
VSDPPLEPSYPVHGPVTWGRSRLNAVPPLCRTLLLKTRREWGRVVKTICLHRRQASSREDARTP